MPESIEPSKFVSHRTRISGEFDSRKDSHPRKFERRSLIFAKLSFRELGNSKLSRGCRQLSFIPINGQLATRGEGGGVEVVILKSMTKSTATIFCIVIKATFKKYFLQH